MKRLKFLLPALAALFFASCRHEANITAPVNYTGNILVNFDNYEGVNDRLFYTKYEVPLKDTTVNVDIVLKLTNTTGTAPEDIKVYLTKVDAVVSDYNTINGTNLTAVSSTDSAFRYDFSKPVIIKKGERRATVDIKLNPAKLNLSRNNAIGLGIARVEGAGAAINSSSQARLVVELGARNKYDGRYNLKGFHNRPTLEDPYDEEVHLITTGPNSVSMYWPALGALAHPIHGGATYYGNFTTEFTFNPVTERLIKVDNPYTPGSPVFTIGPATDSRYVPGSPARIYAQFYYNNNTQRMFSDTLVYLGPR